MDPISNKKDSTSLQAMNQNILLHRLVSRPALLELFLTQSPYGPFDINHQNEHGDTALHLACRGGYLHSCRFLIKVYHNG